eukprot:COSAG03_NODE_14126_length_475_cov_8.207447_1_plen_37_part_10
MHQHTDGAAGSERVCKLVLAPFWAVVCSAWAGGAVGC